MSSQRKNGGKVSGYHGDHVASGSVATESKSANSDFDYSTHQKTIEHLKAQQKIHLTESVRSTHSSLQLGDATTKELTRQGETISSVTNTVDKVEYELKVSDKIVKNMSGIGGMIASWFIRDPKPKEKPTVSENDLQITEKESSKGESRETKLTSRTHQAKDSQRNSFVDNSVNDETDRLFDELSGNLSLMRDQAILQQGILREQHRQLDELNSKVEKVGAHMKHTTRNMKKVS